MMDRSPNLVYVFADQLRRAALGFAGEDPVHTPRLDAFAEQARDLTHAFTTFPLCSPYRGMLFTGRYPHANGILGNCNTRTAPLGCGLRSDRPCLTDAIAASGYALGYIGKWHLDAPRHEDAPWTGGYLSDGQIWDSYTPPGPARHGFGFWHAYGCCDDHLHPHYWVNDAPIEERTDVDGWSVAHETDVALEFLANPGGRLRDPGQPFALFVSWNPPHPPYDQAPREFGVGLANAAPETLLNRPNVRLRGRGAAARAAVADYFTAVQGVDYHFGRILDSLERHGLADDTIVVFTADHGEMMGSHGLMQKGVWYDESTRVPLLIRAPGRLEPGPDDLLIATPDLLPTLMGLMGLAAPSGDGTFGRDYAAQLIGQCGTRPDHALYMWTYPSDPAGGRRGLRTHRYSFTLSRDDADDFSVCLHDCEQDPYQLRNIAPDRPDLVRELGGALFERLRETNDPWLDRTADDQRPGLMGRTDHESPPTD